MVNAVLASVLAAAEESHGAAAYSDGGVLAEWAWLIPVVPLVATFAITFFGKRLPWQGSGIAIAAMGFVAVYGTALFIANMGDGIVYENAVEITRIGPLAIEWGWVVDGLAIMMYAVVGVVGFLVFVYARGYMEGEIRFTFFFAAFSLFAGGMLVLVSAPNFVQLIVGWELVGVSSYLLIAHYWEDLDNAAAGIKAFLTNKIADIGLFIGAIILTLAVGSFRFSDILPAAVDGEISQFAVAAGALLFLGAMGKSAQFPLHVWLPDAMAGPTPVSALMHAATMVTGGVYLLARMFPLYTSIAADAQVIVLTIGTITLFVTGLIALVQDDIKKVLAYSTLSQLGYMVTAMGAGAYTAGLFHLFTHAFFKALLFLAAGAAIHAVHSNNMSDMGGLRKYLPVTFWTFVVGSLALAGIIPFSGFFSKDEILASVGHEGYTFVLVVALLGAFVTAFYMARAVFLTFFGEYKGEAEPHEAPRIMTYPLIGLATGAALFGFFNVPGLFTGFTTWVGARAVPILEHHPESFNFGLGALGLAFGLGGILVGYRFFFADAATQRERDRAFVPVLYPLLVNKYYIDDFYMDGIIKPIRGPVARAVNWVNDYVIDSVLNGVGVLVQRLSQIVYGDLDQRGIDLGINAAAFAAGKAGDTARRLQTGQVQQYAGGAFAVAVVLIAGFWFFG
jgi:NADH-quinone oxidoreductase subunit L